MKTKLKLHLLLLTLLSLSGFAHGQGTAISYQGRLNHAGTPATGLHDFTFKVFDVEAGGAALAGPIVLAAVPVTNGLFNVSLDFGPDIFTGANRWLEIAVRTNSGTGFTSLIPRQVLSPTPYSIFAAKAGAVANGAVTANQLNTGGLPPAPGQFLSYNNGGNLFWSTPPVVAGNVWSRIGADAYYNAGKVGIGTGTAGPLTPLEVNGIVRSTRSGIAPQYIQLNGGDSGSIKLTGQSTPAAEKILFIQNLSGEATPGANNNIQFELGTTAAPSTKMTITKDGNVGIGTTSPQDRLHVFDPAGSVSQRIETGGGVNAWARTEFANANGQWNVGTSRGFNGDQLYFHRQGATVNAFAIQPNGDALLQGNLGIGTTTPGAKLHAETSQPYTAAVYGNATGAGGVGVFGAATTANGTGVYGTSATGAAVHADGNATQARDKGGFVKAMIYVKDGAIVRCFNGINNTSSGECGFVITQPLGINAGVYRINFGFPVSDRFVSVTAEYGDDLSGQYNKGANFRFFDSTSVEVFTFLSGNSADTYPAEFMLILY